MPDIRRLHWADGRDNDALDAVGHRWRAVGRLHVAVRRVRTLAAQRQAVGASTARRAWAACAPGSESMPEHTVPRRRARKRGYPTTLALLTIVEAESEYVVARNRLARVNADAGMPTPTRESAP